MITGIIKGEVRFVKDAKFKDKEGKILLIESRIGRMPELIRVISLNGNGYKEGDDVEIKVRINVGRNGELIAWEV